MINIPQSRPVKITIFVLAIVNILFLDIVVFSRGKNTENTVLLKQSENAQSYMPKTALPTATPTNKPLKESQVTPIPADSKLDDTKKIREIYIPLGSGSTTSSTWDGLEGIEVAIDTNKHGKVINAYFQVALRIPAGVGKASVKLFNETEKHDVWFSELTHEGSTGSFKEAKISIPEGSKLYRIYLMSSLGSEVRLDFARIKLIVED